MPDRERRVLFVQNQPSQLDDPFYSLLSQKRPGSVELALLNGESSERNEIDPELSHSEKGVVAMANSGPDTNGSQWYITYDDVSQLDGGYTIFGRVIEGMDKVEEITPRDPSRDPNAPAGDVIKSIVIEQTGP